ncbi:MAG TPA: class I SAM-dependent methyltransferase [Candidatus Paceibacterota bacterium]
MTDEISDTKAAYDRMGVAYDALSEDFHQQVAYPALLALLERGLGPLRARTILDVGCGSGRLVRLLQQKGAIASGIDLSDGMASRGRAAGVPITTGSMLDLPYEDESFDAVVSYHSFNYVPFPYQRRAIEEQSRVLKRGGTLLLSLFHTDTPVRTPRAVTSEGEELILYLRTLDEMRDLVSSCHCITHQAPVATPAQAALVPENVRALVTERPYALFIVAHRIV